MIRANLLEDDGRDPRDYGQLVSLLTGAVIAVLCVIFVVIAHERVTRETQKVENANTELRAQIQQLDERASQLASMNTRIEEIEAFIASIDADERHQARIKESLGDFAGVFAAPARRRADRQRFDDHGWSHDWSLEDATDWTLSWVNDRWTLSGTGLTAEGLEELARRLDDPKTLAHPGFTTIALADGEDDATPRFRFSWSAVLKEDARETP